MSTTEFGYNERYCLALLLNGKTLNMHTKRFTLDCEDLVELLLTMGRRLHDCITY